MHPLVTFLSDFGLDDPFVGLCHVAILQHAPGARVVDLGHAVRPQEVRQGVARLADAVAFIRGAAADRRPVHLAVVDPGVGSARRALVIAAGDHWLVGPDNGLLIEAGERLGGVAGAWTLPVAEDASATFHGRDVFAPAAGRLAAGADPSELAEPVEAQSLVRLPGPTVRLANRRIVAAVRDVDRYGNVQLAVAGSELDRVGLPATVSLHATDRAATALRVRTFGELEPNVVGVLVDSFGWAAVAVGGGSAAQRLRADLGTEVRITPAG